jgi:SAM-dependent methyltransferase
MTEAQKNLDADERWLHGYFRTDEDDGASKGRSAGAGSSWWKNVDYLRLKDLAIHLLDPKPGTKVLDVGCADGAMMVYCGLTGATVHGVDLDADAVKHANALLRRYQCTGGAHCADASKLPFPDDTFDGVISGDFVEHITDDVKVAVFREIRRVLKPGARMVVKTPNLSYLRMSLRWKQLRALASGKSPFGFKIPHTEGTDNPEHIGLVTRWQLRDAALAAGFLNYGFVYAPLRRFGPSKAVEVLSTEVPLVRDLFSEDLFMVATKPVITSHFPN